MGRSIRARRNERGQTLVLFIAIFTLLLLLGAFAVDQGLWLGERRVSQKDADAAARAGAMEYLADVTNFERAELMAKRIAERNGANTAHELFDVRALATCTTEDGELIETPSVEVDIGRETGSLFVRLLGSSGVTVGTQSTACAGSLNATRGLRPWAISIYESDCFEWHEGERVPIMGQDCLIRVERPASNVGSVRLEPDESDDCALGSGTRDYEDNIEDGSGSFCTIGDDIHTEPGLAQEPTRRALNELLEQECPSAGCGTGWPAGGEEDRPSCDYLFGNRDTYDDFYEVLSAVGGGEPEPSRDVTFVHNDCESPRLVHLILVDYLCQEPSGIDENGDSYCTNTDLSGLQRLEIAGFAAFFIQQCETLDTGGNITGVHRRCEQPAGQSFQVRGRFINLLDLGGPLAPMDPFGTKVIQTVR